MRTKFILFALLIIVVIIFITKSLSQQTVGPHGGKIKQAGNHFIELKNPGSEFYTFLLDKQMKPLSNRDISCEVIFQFPDNIHTKANLLPFGEDGFIAEPIPKYFNSCKITFHANEKDISAEFENENLFVNKK